MQLTAQGLVEVLPGIGTVVASTLPKPTSAARASLLGSELEGLVVEAKKVGMQLDSVLSAVTRHWDRLGGTEPAPAAKGGRKTMARPGDSESASGRLRGTPAVDRCGARTRPDSSGCPAHCAFPAGRRDESRRGTHECVRHKTSHAATATIAPPPSSVEASGPPAPDSAAPVQSPRTPPASRRRLPTSRLRRS